MAQISLASDGMLSVKCEYEERGIVKEIGGRWDGVYKVWHVAFTTDNLEYLLDSFDDVELSAVVEKRVEHQAEKEKKLAHIRKLSKSDAPVRLKVPGLHLKQEDGTKMPISPYNYQKLGIMFAITNGEGVLIADEMGLGKTLQAICTALMLKQQGKVKKALIVTPASLKYNWPMEIEKFTDEPYVVIDGKKPDERIAQWMREDVFFYVVNYELLLADLFGGVTLKEKEDETPEQKAKREERMKTSKRRQRILTPVRTRMWDFIACDEAHALKNSRSKRTRNVKALKSRFRMALTGTPMDGRLEELHSVMEWVMPGLLESKIRFLQKYATTDIWGKITGYRNIHEVTEKIAPYFIRRLKKDVLQDLPDKIYQNRIVVLTDKEKRVYKALAEAGHEVTEDAEALVCVLRCKQFCDHPRLVGETMKSSKYEALREVLEEVVIENGNKAIVFTQFKEMLDILVELFDELGLKYLRIDGDTPKKERADMQTQFNSDSSIDMMIGTEAMSTGLNFTAASYVINYDDNWAPAFMAQREDRAHRIGQKDVVTVVNFICKDTIEERIRSVLYTKNVVSSEALGDDVSDAVLRRITPKEQASLL
jgi:SNF2 family DNA or RNA helicase